MITSKHATVIVLAGLLGVVTTQQGCSSDTSGPTGTVTAGSSGAPTSAAGAGVVAGGSSGMASTTAGAAAAGAPAAGAAATGGDGSGGTGGSTAGAGSSTAGTGGSTAGAGAGAGGGGGGGKAGAGGGSTGGAGGGGAVSFAQIKTIFSASCGTGQCHNKASGQLDYQGTTDLHGLLTTAIPGTGVAHCNGTTLVTANNAAGSFLVTVVTGPGQVTCKKNGADEMIGRMPDNCKTTGGTPACLTAAQIKTISDWIGAGAPS